MSLVARNLNLAHDDVAYLDSISAEFSRGELTAVIGRTLAGKTTLLRAIAGLQALDTGEFELDGQPFGTLPAWRRDVAMVYQQFINYPHLNVFENVAFPLRRKRLDDKEISRRVDAVLATVGLAEFGSRKPGALSGGQQQRVALARALVRQADILLLDEPLVNLDYKLREQMREEFRGLFATQAQAVVIFNTTDPAEAMMIADRIIVMHEGCILQSGTPSDVFEQPATIDVARVINDPPMNIFTGRLENGAVCMDGGLRLKAPPHLARLAPGAYRFGIRASEITLSDASGFGGTVTYSEVSGSETALHIDAEFGTAIVLLEGVYVMAAGRNLRLTIPPDRLFVFEAQGEGRLLSAPDQFGGV